MASDFSPGWIHSDVLGTLAIRTAVTSSRDDSSRNETLKHQCAPYGLNYTEVLIAQSGDEFPGSQRRRCWDAALVALATCVFVWLGWNAVVPPLAMNLQ
jgi:hypothetical protein